MLLNSLTDPEAASELATMADANYSGGLREGIRPYRVEKAAWTERWKDGWNREVEGAVRYVQGIRLRSVREGLEGRAREWKDGDRRV